MRPELYFKFLTKWRILIGDFPYVARTSFLKKLVGPSQSKQLRIELLHVYLYCRYIKLLFDEGPTLETLDLTIRIGSTPTFLYFDLYLNTAYAVHYVYITFG